MKFAATLAAASALALGVLADDTNSTVTVNTPTGATAAIQCEVYQVTWTGGTAPYEIRLLDDSQTFVEEIASDVTASPFQWTVNEPSGDTFIITIVDASGNTGITGQFTIETSSSTSCLSGSTSATAAGSSSSTSASGSSATTTSKSSSATASSSSSSSAASSSSTASSAMTVSAGIAAPVFAALLAFAA